MLARNTERATAPTAPAPIKPAQLPPQPVVEAVVERVPAPAAAKALRVTEDEPPPWMDEAPCEDEAVAAAAVQPPTGPAVVGAMAAHGGRAIVSSLRLDVQRTPLGDRWYEVVAAMVAAGSIAALARELALQAELCEIQQSGATEIWHLTVERDSLRSATHADKLLAALKAVTGQAGLQLNLVAGVAQDSPARRDAEAAALRQQEAEQTIQGDPLVQAMLSQFRTARIVPGSIKPA